MAGVKPTAETLAQAAAQHEKVLHQLGDHDPSSTASEVDTHASVEETGAAGRIPADLSPAALLTADLHGDADGARQLIAQGLASAPEPELSRRLQAALATLPAALS